ncbi:MAG: phosphate-binding protein [Bacilli bacterium]|nr:phosphate-binding protein [Bacilli bacterium]
MIQFSLRKIVTAGFTAALGMALMTGCGTTAGSNGTNTATPAADTLSGNIAIDGSTALLPLAQDAADKFQKLHANVQITLTGNGSGTGVKDVAAGTVQIGMSDVAAAADYNSANLKETDVVLAPFMFITNKDVTVTGLTQQQLVDIFSGKTTNWKDVGGKDEKILVIGRPDNSGSRNLVKSLVMGTSDFGPNIIVQNDSGAVKNSVATQNGSIGYVDYAYTTDGTVNVLKYNNVAFTKDALVNNTYTLFGVERLYTKGTPNAQTQAFIDYILSADYQNQVDQAGKFIPIKYYKKS